MKEDHLMPDQPQPGSLFGTVTDDQGQALPGVTITLFGGAPAIQVSDARGQCRFLDLAPGSYKVKAELEGFIQTDSPNVVISAGRNTEFEVILS
ncbi:MAG TPA: carboxypeptidase-like regulatory domain-containing protein, partial [Thermoanaerobaculia bacterium]|nr:carboxypeptidase-like regulatory domain-containing protein [Thermoanaerobaculia bacterium]